MKHEHEGIGLGISEGNDVFIEGYGMVIEGDGYIIDEGAGYAVDLNPIRL